MSRPIINIALRAARAAGNIIVRSMERMESIQVTEKGKNDFVTEVDKQSEQVIIDTIRQAYPNHSILAEESGKQINQDEETIWIIDPLDGTNNYVHGFPHFAVSIGVQHKGRLEHGLILILLNKKLSLPAAVKAHALMIVVFASANALAYKTLCWGQVFLSVISNTWTLISIHLKR